MSQTGKLYKFYFGKIWQKNWLRIIIFTILIGIVWWFVIPWVGAKVILKAFDNKAESSEEQQQRTEQEAGPFKLMKVIGFGGGEKVPVYLDEALWGSRNRGKPVYVNWHEIRKFNRKILEWYEKRLAEGGEEMSNLSQKQLFHVWGLRMLDSGTLFGILPTPFSSDNNFFFNQTEGYTEGKPFWKLLFDISWWNLAGFVVLYWFIFEVFDKTFFSPHEDGEEAMVLTITPGVKRSDLIWGKILAFLTFYCLINIVIFLIPFGIYYFWLSSVKSFPWFALLGLITVIVGPILFFGLIFAPYLFFGSWTRGQKWIFSTLITFFPMLWGGIKLFSSASWPYTVERYFFDPLWFSVISLICGLLFVALYYWHYQEEDLG